MKKIFLAVLVITLALTPMAFAAPGDVSTGHALNGQTVPLQGAAPYTVVQYTISSNSGFSVTFTGQAWFSITPEIDVWLVYGTDTGTNRVHIAANEHFGRVVNKMVSGITVLPYASGATGTVEIEYM